MKTKQNKTKQKTNKRASRPASKQQQNPTRWTLWANKQQHNTKQNHTKRQSKTKAENNNNNSNNNNNKQTNKQTNKPQTTLWFLTCNLDKVVTGKQTNERTNVQANK